jgi:hypothetical protein
MSQEQKQEQKTDKPGLWWKVQSFFWAVTSFIKHGDAPIREHDRRLLICVSCEYVEYWPPEPKTATNIFCTACDCPRSALSDQRTKARMRDAVCPKGKW